MFPKSYLKAAPLSPLRSKTLLIMAKVISDFARTSEFVKVKGGYLDKRAISATEVQSLADLPPLPVIRAQLLGIISAPASKLVRTLAEPARSMAAVIKSYAEKDAVAPAA